MHSGEACYRRRRDGRLVSYKRADGGSPLESVTAHKGIGGCLKTGPIADFTARQKTLQFLKEPPPIWRELTASLLEIWEAFCLKKSRVVGIEPVVLLIDRNIFAPLWSFATGCAGNRDLLGIWIMIGHPTQSNQICCCANSTLEARQIRITRGSVSSEKVEPQRALSESRR